MSMFFDFYFIYSYVLLTCLHIDLVIELYVHYFTYEPELSTSMFFDFHFYLRI